MRIILAELSCKEEERTIMEKNAELLQSCDLVVNKLELKNCIASFSGLKCHFEQEGEEVGQNEMPYPAGSPTLVIPFI